MASGYFSLYKNCIPIYSNIYIPFDEVQKLVFSAISKTFLPSSYTRKMRWRYAGSTHPSESNNATLNS